MDAGYAILKGIVQGLAEFLPVSSTAHLVFIDALSAMFGWHLTTPSKAEEEFFNILLHLGTMGAVIWYFRVELIAMTRLFLKKPVSDDIPVPAIYAKTLPLDKLPWHLMLSMVATVFFIGVMLKGSEYLAPTLGWTDQGIQDISEFYFHYPRFVAVHLFITGILLFTAQKLADRREGKGEPVSRRQAMAIGLFQGFAAIFHGISRSGSTISAGLATGLDRVSATRYSFLLSLPTFVLATGYEVVKFSRLGHIDDFNWPMLALGTVIAGVVGYFCVKLFIQFVARHKFNGFAAYCCLMGLLMFFLLGAVQ